MEMFEPIRLLTEAFNAHDLKFDVSEGEKYQDIHVPFGIKNGPFVVVRFISFGKGNDVLVRIRNLANRVPGEKRFRVLEALNQLNGRYRFLKFDMDAEQNVHVEYDFPTNTGSESIGEMGFELFIRTMQILNEGYIVLAKALYSEAEETSGTDDDAEKKDLMKLLKNNHNGINIQIRKTESSEEQEE